MILKRFCFAGEVTIFHKKKTVLFLNYSPIKSCRDYDLKSMKSVLTLLIDAQTPRGFPHNDSLMHVINIRYAPTLSNFL